MKKYLPAIFLSIAFVLLLLFLNTRNSLNFVENSPTLTAVVPTQAVEVPWQTYRNEKYGFEFKYPKNYFIKENYSDVFINTREISIPDGAEVLPADMVISTKDISSNKNGEEYISLQTDNIVKNVIDSATLNIETISTPYLGSRLSGKIISNHILAGIYEEDIFLKNPNGKQIVSIMYLNRDWNESYITKSTFDQILSTFKFTN